MDGGCGDPAALTLRSSVLRIAWTSGPAPDTRREGTSSTGGRAAWSSRSATLPSMRPASGPYPRLPTTRSTSACSARSWIARCAAPSRAFPTTSSASMPIPEVPRQRARERAGCGLSHRPASRAESGVLFRDAVALDVAVSGSVLGTPIDCLSSASSARAVAGHQEVREIADVRQRMPVGASRATWACRRTSVVCRVHSRTGEALLPRSGKSTRGVTWLFTIEGVIAA
jgi:hypothetical protein